jgi:hypothetical protein
MMPLPAEAESPDWLRELAPPEAAVPEAPPEEAAPTVPLPTPAEIPDWLRETAPPEAKPPIPPLVELPAEAETTEVPEWLAKLQAQPAPTTPVLEGTTPPLPAEPEIEAAAAEGLARATIPDWLEALRPRPEAVEAPAEEEPVETEGPLEGLRGVLTPSSAIRVPAVRESAVSAEISEASLARARLLQGLLARPAEAPQPKVRKRGVSVAERVQRWLVAAVLLIAVGGTLMGPLMTPNVPTLTQPATFSGVTRSYDTVRGLSVGDTVLVAFEYGPAEADELDLVTVPILRHMFDQGVHISIVSTRPEGLAVAARSLNAIGPPKEQYTLLGYRPGDATGVSQLLADAGTLPRLILVLAAEPGPLRWWIEQTHARGEGAPPILAGLSAALEPSAGPYLDVSAGQLQGMINGLSGAAAYERLRGSAGHATQRLNALAVGHVAIVGLMILGAVSYTLGSPRRRGE